MHSCLLSLSDAGPSAAQGPPPDNDTVTYSVIQKHHPVRGQSCGKHAIGAHSADSDIRKGGCLMSIFHCYNRTPKTGWFITERGLILAYGWFWKPKAGSLYVVMAES